MDFDDLLLVAVNLLQACPDVLEPLPGAVPPRPGRRVPGHQPGPKRAGPAARRGATATCPWSATATSRSTAGGGPTSATSSSSRRPSPTPPSWSWNRTTGRPRPSSTPPTPSSPTTPPASPRPCGPSSDAGEPVIRYHAEDEHDEAAWVAAEIGRLHTVEAPALRRHGRLLPDQRPEPGPGGGTGPPGHPLQGGRRHPVLRPARDQGPARLPAGCRQPGRRGVAPAHRQRAQAGHRRHLVARLAAWATSTRAASPTPRPTRRGRA